MTCHKSEKAAETDAKVKAAIKGLDKGLYLTPYAAAKELQTFYRQLAGGKSRPLKGKENQQNLTHAEEQALNYSTRRQWTKPITRSDLSSATATIVTSQPNL